MKFILTAVLLAAIATLASTAAVPVTPVVGRPLPAKFTLRMIAPPNTGSDLDKFPPDITIDNSTQSSTLNLGGLTHPGIRQIPFIGFNSGKEGIHIKTPRDDPGVWPMYRAWFGEISFAKEVSKGGSGTVAGIATGFVQVDGALAFDGHDKKGARCLWLACPKGTFTENWSVWWLDGLPERDATCYPITLKVVPL